MIVKMKWRDPTIKWGRLDLDFQCKTYRAYGVLDRDGDDFIVHSMFTDELDDFDRVVVCRVPKSCVISITKMTEERELNVEKCRIGKKEELGDKVQHNNSSLQSG